MPAPPSQLAERARLTVRALLRYLSDERPVQKFIDAYAERHERIELRATPARYTELVTTLTREALLQMAARVHQRLPRRIAARAASHLKPAEERAISQFREEFFLEMAKAMYWAPTDLEEFWRDEELYEQVLGRPDALGGKSARPRAGTAVEGPFVDRCGLLLDPSFMEKARRAAAEFRDVLDAAADKVLGVAFSTRAKAR
jgi:hypothetical protein